MNDRRGRMQAVATVLLVVTLLLACGRVTPTGSDATASAPRTESSATPSASAATAAVACAGNAPAWREGPAAAFDPNSGALVVFGGTIGRASVNETWEYIASCWIEVKPFPAPSARFLAALVYDPDVRKSVLIGGRKDNPNGPQTFPQDVWTWDGQSWSLMAGAPHFSIATAAYDEARHVVVVVGAATEGVGTWTWDGTHWTLVCSEYPQASCLGQEPNAARISEAMCFDGATGSILLFGGAGAGVPIFGDTWTWNGTAWTQQHPAHNPPPRFATALSCRTQPVMYGGWGDYSGKALADTWTWDGRDWAELHPAHIPGAKPVMFGLVDGTRQLVFVGTSPGDIWGWTGSDWSAIT